MMETEVCKLHSGLDTAIDNLTKDNINQWEVIGEMRTKVDNIMSRLNVILGGMVVAVVLLLINIMLKSIG